MKRYIDVPVIKKDTKSAVIAKDTLIIDVPLIEREKEYDYNEANDGIIKKSKYTQDKTLPVTVELDTKIIAYAKKASKIVKQEFRKHKPISPEDLKGVSTCFFCNRGKHERCVMKRKMRLCSCSQCLSN